MIFYGRISYSPTQTTMYNAAHSRAKERGDACITLSKDKLKKAMILWEEVHGITDDFETDEFRRKVKELVGATNCSLSQAA